MAASCSETTDVGTRGPAPARSGDHSRARDANRPSRNQGDLTTGVHLEATIPDADPDWGKVASTIWESFHNSGQVEFWQETDWALAYWVCVQVDRHDKAPLARGAAQNMTTILQAMTSLMMTEAERRRARIELERPKPTEVPRHELAVADIRSKLGVAPDAE